MTKRSSSHNEFTFVWKIEHFNFHRSENELKSPLFTVWTSNSVSWYLSFFYDQELQNSYNFFLNKKGSDDDTGNISYEIDINDNNGQILYSTKCDRFSFSSNKIDNVRYKQIFEEIKIINDSITIRCIMILPERITNFVYACKARTKIETEDCSFKWNVKNFSTVDQVSKVFCCSQSVPIKITLSKCQGFVSIVIERDEGNEDIFIACKIALLDVSGIVKDLRISEYSFFKDKYVSWKFPNFIKISDLFSRNGQYLEFNMFSLMCEFSIPCEKTLEEFEYCNHDDLVALLPSTFEDSFANLRENFRRMYVEPLQTDVKIHAGKQTLHAHKFVLSAMSPVFAGMFNQDISENQSGIVDIPDMEVKILDRLLHFMYDGTVDNMDFDSACKLLLAADKYQVLFLKKICSSFLASNLNIENACDVLALADKVAHEFLKDSAVQYIIVHADKILLKEAWTHFIKTNIKLATDVMSQLSILYASHKKY